MRIKGYITAVIAAFFVALSPIGIGFITGNNNAMTSSLIWTASAWFSTFIILMFTKERKTFPKILVKHWKLLLVLGLMNAVGMICWFYSIQTIGPELSSFLGRIGTLVMVIMSVIFLKERFNFLEGIGGLIALFGVYMITFSPVDYLGWKIIYIAVGSSTYAVGQLFTKKHIQDIPTAVLTFGSFAVVTAIIFIFTLITGNLEMPAKESLLVVATVPFLSEAVAVYLVYYSYKHIDVGKTQIIRSTFPFIVIMYSLVLYKKIPLKHQLIGGTLIVGGVTLLIAARRIKKIRKKLGLFLKTNIVGMK